MQIPEVIDVDVVLDEELPVAPRFEAFVRDLGEQPRAEAADVVGQGAQPFRRPAGRAIWMGEHHPGPGSGGSLEKAPVGEVHRCELVLVLWDVAKFAVEGEVPHVIRASDPDPSVAGALEQRHPPMTTHVVKAPELTVEPADNR